MESSYFSLDDILSEAESLSCVFSVECFDLGYLDDSNNDEDIAADATVILPFWMAQPLIQKDIATFAVPEFYGRPFQASLFADPEVINLKDHTPFYYEFGIKIVQIIDGGDIANLLSICFTKRFPMIVNRSGHIRSSSYTPFLLMLANVERQLFDLKNTALEDFRRWRRRKHSLLQPAPSVSGQYVGGNTSAVGQKRPRD